MLLLSLSSFFESNVECNHRTKTADLFSLRAPCRLLLVFVADEAAVVVGSSGGVRAELVVLADDCIVAEEVAVAIVDGFHRKIESCSVLRSGPRPICIGPLNLVSFLLNFTTEYIKLVQVYFKIARVFYN